MTVLEESIIRARMREGRILTIEKALREINEKKRLLDYNLLIFQICEKWHISESTAKEYIKIAKFRIVNWMAEEWGKIHEIYDIEEVKPEELVINTTKKEENHD